MQYLLLIADGLLPGYDAAQEMSWIVLPSEAPRVAAAWDQRKKCFGAPDDNEAFVRLTGLMI